MAGAISPDEYKRWWTPAQAVDSLKTLGLQVAATAIVRRLTTDNLRAAAHTLSWRSGGALDHANFAIIDPDDWRNAREIDDIRYDFWRVGDVTFGVLDHYALDSGAEMTALKVRFDPLGVQAILSPHIPTAAPSAAAEQARGQSGTPSAAPTTIPVSKTEIEDWYRKLPPTDQALGLRKLWRKAQDDHLGRQLPRKLVEPFVEGRKTGRPRKD